MKILILSFGLVWTLATLAVAHEPITLKLWPDGPPRAMVPKSETTVKLIQSYGGVGPSEDVLERLSDLFIQRGVPQHIRSDNGSEFTAKCVREWLHRVEVNTLFIEPGSPWENGYIESFNGKLRDEILNGEIFDTLLEAKLLIEQWRVQYDTIRPHSSLGYRPPTPEAIQTGKSSAA